MKTPVVLIIFNRPNTTEKIFEAVRQAKPSKLFVIADGFRADRPDEAEKCAATRQIIDRVDWECEVLKDYSDVNMGCKLRVISGLDWVFNAVEEAIILEDDCLPDPSFFRFCEKLLEKYRDDKRIMMISGTNILGEWKSDIQDYHFAYYGSIWGWASWRRAWNYYDINMELWAKSEVKQRVKDTICDKKQYLDRQKLWDATYSGMIDTWDYGWSFVRIAQSGLTVIPSGNLVRNIGFSDEATHTRTDNKGLGNLPVFQMSFPLREPFCVAVDREYDRLRHKKMVVNSLGKRIFWKIKRLINGQ